jgi:hypothetical protein
MSLEMIDDVLTHADIATRCPLCGEQFGEGRPATEEHIFPQWLQRHYDLWNRRLTIPNLTEKNYKSVKIKTCDECNKITFGQLETLLSRKFRSEDPYKEVSSFRHEVAMWLGKICWLLICKSHSFQDFRTRHQATMDRVLPAEILPGTLFLGMIQRTFATGKDMFSCFLDDPPIPEFYYMQPYSIYVFQIDQRDERCEKFDFRDDFAVLGGAIRCGSLGVVCIFDGGLHNRFRLGHYADLLDKPLHPTQFNEIVARIFHDQTVIHDAANTVVYFWNCSINAVVARTNSPRNFNHYLDINHDVTQLANRVASYLCVNPEQILPPDGSGLVTTLHDENGEFLRYPVTQAELDAVLAHPKRRRLGPMDKKWRHVIPQDRIAE